MNFTSKISKFNFSVYLVSFLFLAFVLIYEALIFDINYYEYFKYVFEWHGASQLIFNILYMIFYLLIFYFFITFSLLSSRKWKIPFFVIFSFALIYEYGYQMALDRFSDMLDIESAITVTGSQRLSGIITYLNFWFLIPFIVYFYILFFRKNEQNNFDPKKFVLITTFSLVVLFGMSYNSPIEEIRVDRKAPLVSFDAFSRSVTDFLIRGSLLNDNLFVREPVIQPASAHNTLPANNIIIVVDESIRGDHLSLNGYKRSTTPFLEKLNQKGILHNWGIASSATTQSHTSFDMLITGMQSDDLPDPRNEKRKTYPTIFQFAKSLNYKTYFFDGQKINYWGGIPMDTQFIDKYIGVNEFADEHKLENWNVDFLIARHINKIISESRGNFIFVFKRGNHMPYEINFPEEKEIWKPSLRFNKGWAIQIPPPEKLNEFVNSYDNGIKFNVDMFFKKLVDDYENIPNETFILYTSDHGQTLKNTASHSGSTREEALIPMFIIGNLKQKPYTNFKSSHANILPTILDLINYPKNLRKKSYAPSLLNATEKDSKPRFFNPMLQTKIPFD